MPRHPKTFFDRYHEQRLKLAYANVRFKKSKQTYTTKENDASVWWTAKYYSPRKQIAQHLGIPAEDDQIDIDIYTPIEEVHKLFLLLATALKLGEVQTLAEPSSPVSDWLQSCPTKAVKQTLRRYRGRDDGRYTERD